VDGFNLKTDVQWNLNRKNSRPILVCFVEIINCLSFIRFFFLSSLWVTICQLRFLNIHTTYNFMYVKRNNRLYESWKPRERRLTTLCVRSKAKKRHSEGNQLPTLSLLIYYDKRLFDKRMQQIRHHRNSIDYSNCSLFFFGKSNVLGNKATVGSE